MNKDRFSRKDSDIINSINDCPESITIFKKERRAMKTRTLIMVIVVLVACLFSVASGQVPQMMNYQGVLTDSLGNRLDGSYNMTFSLYDTSDGGIPLWIESQYEIFVEQGVFNVLLDIPDSVWAPPQPEMNPRRYLGVSISAHPEMNPRRQIGSVPYAYRAGGDGDWFYPGDGTTPSNRGYVYLHSDDWGIARNSRSSLLGGFKNSHTNLGVDCITGSSTEPNNGYCTAGGGVLNTASGEAATVTGGYGNTAAGDFSLAAGKQVIVDKLADHTFAFGYDFNTSASHAVIFMDTHTPIKVGIGTTSPAYELDVEGTAQIWGFVMPPGASNGYVLTSDISGVGTWQAPAGGIGGSGTTKYISKFTGSTTIGNSVIYETSGYVGIRTTDPALDHPWGSTPHQLNVRSPGGTVPLHLYQEATPSGTPSLIDFSNYNGTTHQKLGQIGTYGNGNELTVVGKDGLVLLADFPPKLGLYVKSSSGNVGIGTTSPTAKLDVNGSTGYNQVRMRSSYTPTGTGDPNGNVGDIAWDNNYFYVKTNAGWKRVALSTW